MICLIYSLLFLFMSLTFFLMSLYFLFFDFSLILEWKIVSLNSNLIFFSMLFDWMSLLFLSFVLFISSMVIFYSLEYMSGDKNLNRFILLVVMFVLSMMFLIISPNLISILLGWDGLGLVSFCLVIYYQNLKSFNSGMLTALSNRVGDVALLMSIAWMLNYGSWNFYFYVDLMKNDYCMNIISVFIVLASLTKSAQIPFSSWLPAAMAAPTPVSSLVHSSTLVTAGVYLLIRFNFSLGSNLMYFLLFISMMTMFMAGIGANFEFDLKKIIALSTLSQLGLMISILALGGYVLAFFHLLTHALFKALLFMCAGSLIHSLNNCQDIRYMGSLIYQMPITCCLFNICNLALCGFPFLSGFYSKDLILEVFSMGYMNFFIYFVYFFSTGLTVSYSFRLMYYLVLNNFNFNCYHKILDNSYIMLSGMSGLIFFVIFGGSMLNWMIFPSFYFICLPFYLKIMVLFIISSGCLLGLLLSKFNLLYKMTYFNFFSNYFFMMWNLTFLSTFGINYYPLYLGSLSNKILDQGWFEYLGSQNIYMNLYRNSIFLHDFFIKSLKIYLTLLMIWILYLMI
uniref:NADH-ubiquinone oxidoreductase chain 5 n=1 Tax=Chauliognathus opacus TaxID=528223 RepID=D1G5K3_CHAOP|nr:NADH dehydrogenase subunit 5 [Chauliognathus opacus]ACM45018.1 NADH dehydrogenase subunit 5 [Chauliognathus opacus]